MDAVPRQGLGCPEIWWGAGRVAQGCAVGIWSARKHHLAPCAFFRAALASAEVVSAPLPERHSVLLATSGVAWQESLNSLHRQGVQAFLKCRRRCSQASGPTKLVLLPSGPWVGSWTNSSPLPTSPHPPGPPHERRTVLGARETAGRLELRPPSHPAPRVWSHS